MFGLAFGVAGWFVVLRGGMAAHRAFVGIRRTGLHHFAFAFAATHHSVMAHHPMIVFMGGASCDEKNCGGDENEVDRFHKAIFVGLEVRR